MSFSTQLNNNLRGAKIHFSTVFFNNTITRYTRFRIIHMNSNSNIWSGLSLSCHNVRWHHIAVSTLDCEFEAFHFLLAFKYIFHLYFELMWCPPLTAHCVHWRAYCCFEFQLKLQIHNWKFSFRMLNESIVNCNVSFMTNVNPKTRN